MSDATPKPLANVYHAELWGASPGKYDWLGTASVGSTNWTILQPVQPPGLFMPADEGTAGDWAQYRGLPETMSLSGAPAPGIVTTHDDFAISWDAAEATTKVERLLATETEKEARALFRLCSQDQWRYERAKAELADGSWRQAVVRILYRPFDQRYTVYDRNVAVHRRERVSRHLCQRSNVGVVTTRQTKDPWSTFALDTVAGHKSCAAYDINYVFPLYLYPDPAQRTLLEDGDWPAGEGGRVPNLARGWVERLAAAVRLRFEPGANAVAHLVGPRRVDPGAGGDWFGPEDLFGYLYAVFHAPSYRQRYAELLRRDFPRVPLTERTELFWQLVTAGAELVRLHLLDHPLLQASPVSFPVPGSNRVEKGYPRHLSGPQRVQINATQYFEGVSQAVWEFPVGGYQVAAKWLKDRVGRILTGDELEHYRRTITALGETAARMQQIDQVIDDSGGWPL